MLTVDQKIMRKDIIKQVDPKNAGIKVLGDSSEPVVDVLLATVLIVIVLKLMGIKGNMSLELMNRTLSLMLHLPVLELTIPGNYQLFTRYLF